MIKLFYILDIESDENSSNDRKNSSSLTLYPTCWLDWNFWIQIPLLAISILFYWHSKQTCWTVKVSTYQICFFVFYLTSFPSLDAIYVKGDSNIISILCWFITHEHSKLSQITRKIWMDNIMLDPENNPNKFKNWYCSPPPHISWLLYMRTLKKISCWPEGDFLAGTVMAAPALL